MNEGLAVRAVVRDRGVDVELTVAQGTTTAVLGPNGAGKSTLLAVIAGLHRPDAGRVSLDGRVLTDIDGGIDVPPHKRGTALMAQQPLLFPHMTAATNVAFAPRSAGRGRRVSAEAATHWLAEVDAAELADRRPAQLSGGQAQRVAVARALAADPTLLLLDEPMAALDVGAAPMLRTMLRRVLRDEPRTALLVTHDALDALALADRVVVLDAGRVVEEGEVRSVLTRPRSAFAARIAGINLCSGVIQTDGALRTLSGAVVQGASPESLAPNTRGVAVFAPAAVSVYAELPQGSPRNSFHVTVSEIENRGDTVRLRAADHGGDPGLAADVTPAAAADLDVAPGRTYYFVVKATETQLYAAT